MERGRGHKRDASFGATPDEIEEGLRGFRQPSGRMKVLNIGTWTVIDDTYNANPDSVAAALKSLSLMKGRRVAVLGEMFELGAGKARFIKKRAPRRRSSA